VVVDEADPGAVSVDRSWLREVTLKGSLTS
jgi:hypothetical protein